MDLNHLNPAQQEAVRTTDGPVMILAGAGSGKTRTLISRIHYLLEHKQLSPYQILAVTFSNKAAHEMRERLSQITTHDIGTFQITTFHAFCAKVLRYEAQYLGLSRSFTIYDDGESLSVIKSIMARHGISQKDTSPYEISRYIDSLKNTGYYLGDPLPDDFPLDERMQNLFKDYEAEIAKNNAVDFGGLLTGVIKLFKQFPDVLEKYQQKFKYVLVDEYQDTNRAQFELIKMIAQKHQNICVVGDEDQSIYSWRGADIRNILDFETIFAPSKLIKLEQNYRSSKTIIEAATVLISKNKERKGKNMWTENPGGDAIEVVECRDDRVEGEYVAKEIKKLLLTGVSPLDIAVIYRNNSQSRTIEDHLIKEKVSYKIVAGIKFYDRKEIKDILSYLRLVTNQDDSLAFTRIINVPARGIGTTSLRKLEDEAIRSNISLFKLIDLMVENPGEYKHLSLSGKVQSGLRQLTYLINEAMVLENNQEKPSIIFQKILNESGYFEFINLDKSPEGKSRLENLEELLYAIKIFEEETPEPSVLKFLETITLDTGKEEDKAGMVALMTAHGSKGLEFPYVFLVGAEENIFPSFKSAELGPQAIEEERRLFYVAMTRAMKKLFITFAQSRMLWGSVRFNGPSIFINELPDDKYKWTMLNAGQKAYEEDTQEFPDYDVEAVFSEKTYYQSKPKSSSKFPAGTKVAHSLYGNGTILDVEGSGGDEKVQILFYDGSKKKFLVKFAPLQRI